MNSRTFALWTIVPVVIAFVVFMDCGDAEFLNWDDDDYVTERSEIAHGLTPDGIYWAFTTYTASNWHPLAWMSYVLDIELFGTSARAMHLVNVYLHVANTVLTAFVVRSYLRREWRALIIAAFFAVHSQHV